MSAKWLIEQKNGSPFIIPTKIISPRHAKKALSPLAWKILEELAKGCDYPKNLAKKIRVHEQKIYYHIRNLKKAGFIKIIKEENIHGVTAKYYGVDKPSFALLLKEMETTNRFSLKSRLPREEEFLAPFVYNNRLNSLIVLGSPEPHGPTRARAKDGVYSINLGLFLGGFLNNISPNLIKLDTEIKKDDLKNNLILIGGPGVNQVSAMVNNKLPVRLKEYQKNQYSAICSSISKKTYPEEECGLIVKMKNPFDSDKQILVIAGRRAAGTKAAILAFTNNFADIYKGNKYNPKICAKVVEGIDSDSDGAIDSVEIRE